MYDRDPWGKVGKGRMTLKGRQKERKAKNRHEGAEENE